MARREVPGRLRWPLTAPSRCALPWPLPALLAWSAAWGVFLGGVQAMGWPPASSAALAVLTAIAACAWCATRPRRLIVAAGFPLSLAASGLAAGVPAWAWLLPLCALAFVYPLSTWRDAPMFPTPSGALRGLAQRVPLPAGARVLDAGCGVGHALRELHREYPGARLEGIERSRPLRWACAMRAPFARLHGGDLWAARWSAYDLVYVFQRPDTMARIAQKAREELPAGAWLVSLEFEVPGWQATASWEAREARKVWAYRMGAAGSLPVSQRPSSR